MSTTIERKVTVASGLGDADASQVMAGSTFSSESGFNQEGKFIPSADNITYDNATSKLGSTNTQGAIDEIVTLTNESGHSIDVTLNKSTYVMAISLKDKNGEVLNEKTVDFPMETAFVNASYDKASKTMKFTLESGSTVDVPLGDLVEGLVSQTDFDVLSDKVETLKTEVNNNTNAISEIEANITTVEVRLEFEKGDLDDDDGLPVSSTEYKRTINYIKVIPNTEYTISRSNNYNLYVFGFQSEGIAVTDGTGTTNKFVVYNTTESEVCFTTTSTTQYIKVVVKNLDLSEEITFSLTNSIGEIVVDNMNNIDNINSSMSDYGLNNVFDGELVNGYHDCTNGNFVNNTTVVEVKNAISVNNGDTVSVKTERIFEYICCVLFNGETYVSGDYVRNNNEFTFIIPSGVNRVYVYFSNGATITPSTAGHIGVYVNNSIDIIKNEVDDIKSKVYTYKKWMDNGETVEVPCSDYSIVTVIGNNPAFYALCYVGDVEFVKPISVDNISVSNHVDGKVTITNSTGYGMPIAIKVERIV